MEKIIIVGAGAAGLIAGCKLADEQREVIIFEARDRIGGRMHTFQSDFTRLVEEGAEFIHGELPLTISQLNEAGSHYYSTKGRIWRYFQGELETDNSFIEDDQKLTKALKKIEKDIPVKEFLETNFDKEKNFMLIESTKKFVEGYDSADYSRASTFALRDEWTKSDDDKQFRIAGGYKILYDHLEKKFTAAGGKIILNKNVNEIRHYADHCEIVSDDIETADKVIVTVPTGVLADRDGKGHIRFTPAIPELNNWIVKSGYGWLIKIAIEFSIPFWENEKFEDEKVNQTKGMLFLFTDQKIPTWWTQAPDSYPLLSGWLSGTAARDMKDVSDEEILEHGINSLCKIYNIKKAELKKLIKSTHVKNWCNDPFTCGSYSYKTPETVDAYQLMKKPFGALYFAGEALTEGSDNGTVEAALLSGTRIAESINNPD
jgi:monoamine oxidase